MRSNRFTFPYQILTAIVLMGALGVTSVGCEEIDIRTSTPFDAPVHGLPIDGVVDPHIIPDSYIVVLQPDTSEAARGRLEADLHTMGVTVKDHYESTSLHAFWAIIPASKLDDVRRKNEIAWLEVDRYAQRTSAGMQTCPGWNLDLLDHQSPALSTISASNMEDDVYSYEATGASANILVVDTGIRSGIPTLQVRNKDDSGHLWTLDRCNDDRDGHGTMVATIIGDKKLGVAKEAKLIPFNADKGKCFDLGAPDKCATSCPDVCPVGLLPGHDFYAVLQDVKAAMPKFPKPLLIVFPYAVHVSDPQAAFDGLVKDIIDAGGVFVVSAGNGEMVNGQWVTDACQFKPGNFAIDPVIGNGVITVGALSASGKVGAFNTGQCVDVFAPGVGIRTRNPDNACGAAGEVIVEGTSFAAAHAAGVAAQLIEQGAGAADVKLQLLNAARKMDHMGGMSGTTNRVLHGPLMVNIVESGTVDADGAADFVCAGAACAMCSADGLTNPCTDGVTPECSGRMQCTGVECAPCGREGSHCCSMGVKCEGNLECNSNDFCACGEKGQACCNESGVQKCGTGLACSNDTCVDGCTATCCKGPPVVLGDIPNDECIRDGGGGCWDQGGPAEIRNKGAKIWGPSQCSGLKPAEAVCCDGTKIQLNPQFDETVAAQIAKEECNLGPDSKVRETYMDGQIIDSIFLHGQFISGKYIPGTCGTCDVLCCDGTKVGGDFAWSGFSDQNACNLFGGLSCREHGYGPQRITYDADPLDATPGNIIWSKEYGSCPTMHPCVATCKDGNTIFIDDYFSEDHCNLFATAGCASYGGLLDAELLDPSSLCTARCNEGQLLHTKDQVFSGDDCVKWGENVCVTGGFGILRRARLNSEIVFDYDKGSPGTCGSSNRYCCDTNDDLDGDGTIDDCINSPGDKCVEFAPPVGAIGLAYCSDCGSLGQKCCANDQCGKYRTCTDNNGNKSCQ